MNALLQNHVKCELKHNSKGQSYIRIKGKTVRCRTNRCQCGKSLMFDLEDRPGYNLLSAVCESLDYGSYTQASFVEPDLTQSTLDSFGAIQ